MEDPLRAQLVHILDSNLRQVAVTASRVIAVIRQPICLRLGSQQISGNNVDLSLELLNWSGFGSHLHPNKDEGHADRLPESTQLRPFLIGLGHRVAQTLLPRWTTAAQTVLPPVQSISIFLCMHT